MRRLPLPAVSPRLRYVGVAAVAALIGYYSLTGTPPRAPTTGPLWDKQLHFLGYAMFGLSVAYATIDRSPGERVLFVLLCAGLYGVSIELIQGALPARHYGAGDMLANLLGATLSLAWLLVERNVRYVAV